MPSIYNKLDKYLKEGLYKTLESSKIADFCIGYFNLRGWRIIANNIEKIGRWFPFLRICRRNQILNQGDHWIVPNELAGFIENSKATEKLNSPYHFYLKIAYHLSKVQTIHRFWNVSEIEDRVPSAVRHGQYCNNGIYSVACANNINSFPFQSLNQIHLMRFKDQKRNGQ